MFLESPPAVPLHVEGRKVRPSSQGLKIPKSFSGLTTTYDLLYFKYRPHVVVKYCTSSTDEVTRYEDRLCLLRRSASAVKRSPVRS